MYFIGYFVPYCIQIIIGGEYVVIVTNFICGFTILLLFVYEFYQIREQGFTKYISDFWNIMDFTNITLFFMYFPLRFYLAD